VLVLAAAIASSLSGCGSGSGSGETPTPAAPADFEATAADFGCILDWPRVRNIRITNKLGFEAEAVALAENPEPGKQFPVGTIVQLFPGEAMVKRGPDYDPNNNNWEYFELRPSTDGTAINVRGRDDVINMFGGQCFGCHVAARDFDFLCEKNRGCVNLPVGDDVINALQNGDPRCAH
jgi:hypothetical protein